MTGKPIDVRPALPHLAADHRDVTDQGFPVGDARRECTCEG